MPEHVEKVIGVPLHESLTTSHLDRALTTAHLQQQLHQDPQHATQEPQASPTPSHDSSSSGPPPPSGE
jgi:hypothetical protein